MLGGGWSGAMNMQFGNAVHTLDLINSFVQLPILSRQTALGVGGPMVAKHNQSQDKRDQRRDCGGAQAN